MVLENLGDLPSISCIYKYNSSKNLSKEHMPDFCRLSFNSWNAVLLKNPPNQFSTNTNLAIRSPGGLIPVHVHIVAKDSLKLWGPLGPSQSQHAAA